jgi:hypothetical protein
MLCFDFYFVTDPMNAHRYFAYHINGVHSLDLQWLDNLSDAYKKTCKIIDSCKHSKFFILYITISTSNK